MLQRKGHRGRRFSLGKLVATRRSLGSSYLPWRLFLPSARCFPERGRDRDSPLFAARGITFAAFVFHENRDLIETTRLAHDFHPRLIAGCLPSRRAIISARIGIEAPWAVAWQRKSLHFPKSRASIEEVGFRNFYLAVGQLSGKGSIRITFRSAYRYYFAVDWRSIRIRRANRKERRADEIISRPF